MNEIDAQNYYQLVVPSALKDELWDQGGHLFKNKQKELDKWMVAASLIYSHREDGRYTHVHSDKFKNLLGNDYKRIIDLGKRKNYFDVFKKYYSRSNAKESYERGKFSKAYAIKEEFFGEPTIYTVQDNDVRRALRRGYVRRLGKYRSITSILKWLPGATIDEGKAIEIAEKEYCIYQEALEKGARVKDGEIFKEDPEASYKHNLRTIFEISNKVQRFSRDRSGERLHTPITNASRGVRNFITYEGKGLTSLDLSNSQPYLLIGMLNPEVWESRRLPPPIQYATKDIDTSLCRPIINEIQCRGEFQRYASLAASGELYEHFAKLMSDNGRRTYSRNEVKSRFLVGMYDQNRKNLTGFRRVFRDEFPNIFDLITLLKSKDYTRFPVSLQRLESSIFLNHTANQITCKFPELPFFTLHDSIITLDKAAPEVEKIMSEVLTEQIGFSPLIKLERWSSENAEAHLVGLENELQYFLSNKE